MNSDRIRVGLIGANPDRGWACNVHVPALQASPDFEITAVATTRAETAKAAADKWGAAGAYTDPGRLAADPNVDLVVVSVKTQHHRALVRAALDAGKHVFCEWPLALDMPEVRELAQMARSASARTIIGLQARAAPELLYVRDLVAQGYVGKVMSCIMTATTGGWGAQTDQANAYLADRSNGATVLSIPGGHSLDALCFVLGEFRDVSSRVETLRPTMRVVETGETIPKTSPDQVAVNGTLESGAVVSAHIQSGVLHTQGLRFEIHGTEGDIVVTSSGPELIGLANLRVQGATGMPARPHLGKPVEDLAIPESYRLAPAEVPRGIYFNVAQLYALIAADLRDGGSRAPDFEDALGRHTLLDAIQQASDTGQRQVLR